MNNDFPKQPVTFAKGDLIFVGFWSATPEQASDRLPWPGALIDPNWNEVERLKVLLHLKNGKNVAQYRGSSGCRLCGIRNGSCDLSDGRYVWPQGFAHYVEAHHVKPPEAFILWVLGASS